MWRESYGTTVLTAATVVLVEGESDALAVGAAARRCGIDLAASSVEVQAMGGASNVGRFVEGLADTVRLVGLCDAGEQAQFAVALAGTGSPWFVCDRDLEDELIRALGLDRVEAIIAAEGELASLRKLQQMPYHRGGDLGDQVRRFLACRSGRKARYAPVLVEALEPGDLPAPLLGLLDRVIA